MKGGCRIRWRIGLVTASSALLAGGCGGSANHRVKPPPPRIPAGVAQLLAADADAVALRSDCSARPAALKLQTDVLDNIDRIPQRYREQLQSAANSLAFRVPECPPPEENHGKHKGHKKKHGHDEGD